METRPARLDLIALNAQLFGSSLAAEDAQWAWLADQLDTMSATRRVVLVMHRPLAAPDSELAAARPTGSCYARHATDSNGCWMAAPCHWWSPVMSTCRRGPGKPGRTSRHDADRPHRRHPRPLRPLTRRAKARRSSAAASGSFRSLGFR
jgi:hypothetical protein